VYYPKLREGGNGRERGELKYEKGDVMFEARHDSGREVDNEAVSCGVRWVSKDEAS
jgi:hypothetical protein